MKIVCGEGVVDLDMINDFRPDNTHLYCQVVPAGYHNGTNVPEDRNGKYILTSDKGIINFEDIAFKMLFDFAIRFSLPNMRYIVNEMAEAMRDEEGEDDGVIEVLTQMKDDTPMSIVLADRNIIRVHLRNVSKIRKMNLRILAEYDMFKCTNACHPAFTDIEMNANKIDREYRKTYVYGYDEMIDMIAGRVYVPEDQRTFWGIYDALFAWFCEADSTDFRDFVNNFYEKLDKIIYIGYSKRVAIETRLDAPVPVVKSEEDTSVGNDSNPNKENGGDIKSAPATPVKTARISGSDITGVDQTYTSQYCEGFYDRDLNNSDSDGYLEKLIISRANNKAAPIDILNETIANKHSKDDPANTLRNNLASLRETAEDAINHEE